MELIKLQLSFIDELLRLEGNMYWQSKKWKDLWQEEAKDKFKSFIVDYLVNFPQGCFGLVDKDGQLLGAIFLIRISKLKPISYFHKVFDHLREDGEIAYVSFFVVKRGSKEKEVAQKLYNEAEEIALFKLGCKTMAVVIYSSPLEEEILEGNIYKKLSKQFEWEIYPGKKVPCFLYSLKLLAREEKSREGEAVAPKRW